MSSRWWKVLAACVVVAVLLAGAYFWIWRDTQPSTALVERGSLEATVETVGTLQPTDPLLLRTSVSGTVLRLGAQPGDVIQAGDIVVMLHPEPFQEAIDQAHVRLERAEFALQIAESDEPESSSGPSASLVDAQANVRAAEDSLDQAEQALRDTVISAPAESIVLELPAATGSPVTGNQVVARLMQPSALELSAQLSEVDLPSVSPGTSVTFRTDAFPNVEIEGTVKSISPEAATQSGATSFATTIVFEPPADVDLRPGMNAEVTFITSAREGVLLIPESAVKSVGNRTYVTVIRDGEELEIEVLLGQRAQGKAEVIDGLAEGERVVIP